MQEAFESVRDGFAWFGFGSAIVALIWVGVMIKKLIKKGSSRQPDGSSTEEPENDPAVAACAVEGLVIH